MRFNHLNVPEHWQNYWTRYPEGHTILEALISWVSQVDAMVDDQNKLHDNVEQFQNEINANVEQFRNEIDAFVGKFDDRLQDEVTQTLNEWQTSGFLEVVINEALQWQLDEYITTNEQDKLTITEQLAQSQEDLLNFANYSRPVDDAAYSWWINPLAISEDSKTFISSVGSTGKMTITCFDHDAKTMERTEIADYEGDDHNAMSVNFMRDGRVIVMYARHNADSVVRARVSIRPYDISEFGEEVILESSGGVTYVQAFDSGFDQYLRIIYRTGVYKWGTALFSRDTGTFTTSEIIWLNSGSGQYYVVAMPYADGSRRTRLFMYGHPKIDPLKNHVRYGYIGANSELITVGGVTLGSLNLQGNLPTKPDQYYLAYTPPEDKKMRLLDVAVSNTPKFVFSEFDNGNNSQYKEAIWNGTSFDTIDITESGRAVEVPAGANFYYGGVSYEKRNDNIIYLAREVSGLWKVEKWVKTDNTWVFDESIDENTDKIFRPYSVFNGTSDMKLTYLKGTYRTYTNYNTSLLAK